jgi:hypothetical protein
MKIARPRRKGTREMRGGPCTRGQDARNGLKISWGAVYAENAAQAVVSSGCSFVYFVIPTIVKTF